MIGSLALAAASVFVGSEPLDPSYCPGGTIGYVRVMKDGYRIAGGKGSYDPKSGALTASSASNRMIEDTMTLKLDPVRLNTEGIGAIQVHNGVFCAYPLP